MKKTIAELVEQEPVFLNNLKCVADIENEFDTKLTNNEKVLFASYGTDNYSGDAWILIEKQGKLFEVNGSHCSCYGLEGQFQPEEVQLPELYQRVTKGTFGIDDWSGNEFNSELKAFLGVESEVSNG